MTIMPNLLAIAAFVLLTESSLAHDFWIHVSDYQPEPGDRVELDVRVGQNFFGDSLPRIDNWFSRFEASDSLGVYAIEGDLGDEPAGSVLVEKDYTVVIYRSTRKFVELESEEFESYLRDEGLESIIETRQSQGDEDEPGREWFSRCAKTLIKPVGANSTGSDHDFSMTLEIIPLQDPYAASVGDDLTYQLNYLGAPLQGALLVAYNSRQPEQKYRMRTDAEGQARLPLVRNGEWLIKAVHMVAAPANKSGIDWESFWASLTFKI